MYVFSIALYQAPNGHAGVKDEVAHDIQTVFHSYRCAKKWGQMHGHGSKRSDQKWANEPPVKKHVRLDVSQINARLIKFKQQNRCVTLCSKHRSPLLSKLCSHCQHVC